ncbi:MAG: hypothetical protein OXU68_09795 [Bacteroidota bacterium]|nr:hypothetical protein [Bacteroidota bacterium]
MAQSAYAHKHMTRRRTLTQRLEQLYLIHILALQGPVMFGPHQYIAL